MYKLKGVHKLKVFCLFFLKGGKLFRDQDLAVAKRSNKSNVIYK
jgi:hypothetical protein